MCDVSLVLVERQMEVVTQEGFDFLSEMLS